jgi:hypothetical protein
MRLIVFPIVMRMNGSTIWFPSFPMIKMAIPMKMGPTKDTTFLYPVS